MKTRSVLSEAEDILRAAEMARLGARMQMLETETRLSRERLLRIYKEVRGASPPKGMLPFSTDWFMTWQANVHSSLFSALHRFYCGWPGMERLDAILKAYHLYLDHIEAGGLEPVLSLTRAWTLVRFFEAELLQLASCTRCGGHFVTHAHDPVQHFVCGLCNMPSRAGKPGTGARARSARPAVRRTRAVQPA